MAIYAMILGGVFQYTQEHEQRPPNIPHKNVVWLPVVREVELIDHATERHIAKTETIDVPGDRFHVYIGKAAKTAQEIDAPKQDEADEEMSRALALVVLDEFNVTRAAINEIRDALTALVQNNPALDRTGLKAVAHLEPRTVNQLKNAIKAKL